MWATFPLNLKLLQFNEKDSVELPVPVHNIRKTAVVKYQYHYYCRYHHYQHIYIFINLHISKVANEDCSYDSIQRKPPVVVATGIVPSNTEKNSYDGIIITGSIIHQSVEALLDEEIVHCIILLLLSLCLYVIYQRRGSKHCYYSRCDDTGIINLYHKETTVRHRCTFTYLGYKG